MLHEHVATGEEQAMGTTRLNNHQAGRNGDRTLGQCASSNARSEVFCEAAGCLSGIYAGVEEKDVFGILRAEPIWKKFPSKEIFKSGKIT